MVVYLIYFILQLLESLEATYLPKGPQVKVPEEKITNGRWILCHKQTFNGALNDNKLRSIQRNKCSKKKVLVGCKKVGSKVLDVLAWADNRVVFGMTDASQCGALCNGNVAQGTKWYWATQKKIGQGGAWGFAKSDAKINLSTVDWLDKNDPKRISYWLRATAGPGTGYRCGASIVADSNTGQLWELEFYHAY